MQVLVGTHIGNEMHIHINITYNISVYNISVEDVDSPTNIEYRQSADDCRKEIYKLISINMIEGKRSYSIKQCDLDQFKMIRPTLLKFNKKLLNYLYTKGSIVIYDYSNSDPLLSFVGFECGFQCIAGSGDNKNGKSLDTIFGDYIDEFSKKSVLDCQQDLINNGFAGNAHW
jgi:hypothetical protein